MRTKRLKICLAASSGGHLTQLLKVVDCTQGHNRFFVTSLEVARKKVSQYGPVFIVGECNRQHPIETLKVLMRCLKIVCNEKPDVVISTGAAPGLLVCLAGYLRGAKVIWLDSIANARRLSMSGRLVRPFADLIFSQWPHVAQQYKNVEYAGEVI